MSKGSSHFSNSSELPGCCHDEKLTELGREARMKPAVLTAHLRNQQKMESCEQGPAHRECLPLWDLADCLLDAYESVTSRAHQKYLARGALPGQELEDWIHAEREVLGEVHADFEQSDGFLYALASLPDFRAAEISVAVEPRWLLILARSESSAEGDGAVDDSPRQCFSMFELGYEVDCAGTIAVLSGGLLAVRMPKSMT